MHQKVLNSWINTSLIHLLRVPRFSTDLVIELIKKIKNNKTPAPNINAGWETKNFFMITLIPENLSAMVIQIHSLTKT